MAPLSMVAPKDLGDLPNIWIEAPKEKVPFAGIDIENTIVAGKNWGHGDSRRRAGQVPVDSRRRAGNADDGNMDGESDTEPSDFDSGFPPPYDPSPDPTVIKRAYNLIDPHRLATRDCAYTRAWYQFTMSVYPNSSWRFDGLAAEEGDPRRYPTEKLSSLQLSAMFVNMGNMGRKPHVVNEIGKKHFKNRDMMPVLEFWGSSWPHLIMTAEAAELPRDPNELMSRFGLVGDHTDPIHHEFEDLAVHARVGRTGYVTLIWESEREEFNIGHAAIFEVDFGLSVDPLSTTSYETSVDFPQMSDELREAIAEGQHVYRAGLNTIRCCVMHVHNQTARKRTLTARRWIWKVLT